MIELFEIQFKAIGDVRCKHKVDGNYLKQFIKIMTLLEKSYSFDNFTFLVGKELAGQKNNVMSNDKTTECTMDAFNILESLNRRFNYDYVDIN